MVTIGMHFAAVEVYIKEKERERGGGGGETLNYSNEHFLFYVVVLPAFTNFNVGPGFGIVIT